MYMPLVHLVFSVIKVASLWGRLLQPSNVCVGNCSLPLPSPPLPASPCIPPLARPMDLSPTHPPCRGVVLICPPCLTKECLTRWHARVLPSHCMQVCVCVCVVCVCLCGVCVGGGWCGVCDVVWCVCVCLCGVWCVCICSVWCVRVHMHVSCLLCGNVNNVQNVWNGDRFRAVCGEDSCHGPQGSGPGGVR